jgi:hypothetical protein
MKKSKALWIFAIILIVINALEYIFSWGGETGLQFFSDVFPIICSFISCICLFLAFKSFKQFDVAKTTWLLIFIGICLYFIAETTYAILEIGFKMDMNNIFPSNADFFWCTGYIPLVLGLLMMYFGYKKSGFPMGNKRRYFIISILVFALSIIVFWFILIPIFKDSGTSVLSKFFYMYYPVVDLLVVIPAIILMNITSIFGKKSISRPWMYLAIGFICFTVADLLYSYLSWRDLYGSGNYIDIAWNFGYLATGLAGLFQREMIQSINVV